MVLKIFDYILKQASISMLISIVILCIEVGKCENIFVQSSPEVNNNGITNSPFHNSTESIQLKNITCGINNGDCTGCVRNTQCYYCESTKVCDLYVEHLIPTTCGLKQAHYLTCRWSFEIMLIIIGVLIGIVLIIILISICYFCCKKRGFKMSKDELKWARKRDERKQLAAEKRREREERSEEIRRKYGLIKDSNPYERFDS